MGTLMVYGYILDVGGVLQRREGVRETGEGDDLSSHVVLARHS